jgi:hypothetical protein
LNRLVSKRLHGADFISSNAASLSGLLRHILATILGDATGLVNGAELPETHWCAAELLRIAALGQIKEGRTPAAQRLLKEALSIAKQQGAFAWELRAATTLGESLVAEGQLIAARDVLAPVVHRAAEGFETGDFRRAAELLAKIDAG